MLPSDTLFTFHENNVVMSGSSLSPKLKKQTWNSPSKKKAIKKGENSNKLPSTCGEGKITAFIIF